MTDETNDRDKDGRHTLADYIPPVPPPSRASRKMSKADRDRLEQIERAVRDTEPDNVRRSKDRRNSERDARPTRRKPSGGSGKIIFWAIVIMFVLVFVLD